MVVKREVVMRERGCRCGGIVSCVSSPVAWNGVMIGSGRIAGASLDHANWEVSNSVYVTSGGGRGAGVYEVVATEQTFGGVK